MIDSTASRNSPAPPAWSRAPTWWWSAAGRRASRPRSRRAAQGCSVTLVERYPYLGGLASGGMVLVLDDMHNGEEITVTRLCTGDDRAHGEGRRGRLPAAGGPRGRIWAMYRSGRAGARSISARRRSRSRSCFAAAFDPDGWKRVSNEMIAEAGVERAAALVVLQGASCRTAASRA